MRRGDKVSCLTCGGEIILKSNNLKKKYCNGTCSAAALRGKPKSDEHRAKIKANHARPHLGKKQPAEQVAATRARLAKWQSGPNHWNWKGGITPTLKRLRFTAEYTAWRTAVYERDAYTCQMCGQVGGKLNADHIIPYAKLVREEDWATLYDTDNGRTLCIPCHKLTPTYGVKAGAL